MDFPFQLLLVTELGLTKPKNHASKLINSRKFILLLVYLNWMRLIQLMFINKVKLLLDWTKYIYCLFLNLIHKYIFRFYNKKEEENIWISSSSLCMVNFLSSYDLHIICFRSISNFYLAYFRSFFSTNLALLL